MRRMESIKRLVVLQLTTIGLLIQVVAYGYVWYKYYEPVIKLFFWGRGNWLVIGLYAALLLFFTSAYGGTKIGYLKPLDVYLSQVFALLIANIFSYFQISLMCEWFAPTKPILIMTAIQLFFALIWVFASDFFYKMVFPPRQLLLVHGDRPIDDILYKFGTRKDRYIITECININRGIEVIQEEILKRYDGIVLWDIPTNDRNTLMKYCYNKSIRVYMMPKIPDVILMGCEKMHLFDTPILLTREYALRIEQRIIKRTIDLVCALILVIITSPIMLITALIIKLSDGGPVLYKQVRCTLGNKEFKIVKFRSMRVDAEKDGVARLASKGDPRITPFGRFIRKVRIDELPQLFNIIKGDMSFIGPRPERPEIIEQYLESMPEFAFRTKVKAGLAGYAQVYGKYNTTPYDKLKLDLTYIENYSVWLDIKLMLLTLKVLITPDSTEGVEQNQKTAMKIVDKSVEPVEEQQDKES
ncbi:MAG: sugar transferase [Lachnospiraceae bacterium]|nr:sugar transferase [Lachnospiraceae bacterium]